MNYLLIIVFIIILGFLGFLLFKKKTQDQSLLDEYHAQLGEIKADIAKNKEDLNNYETKIINLQLQCHDEYLNLQQMREQLNDAKAQYDDIVNHKSKEINQMFDEQREQRQKQLDDTFKETQEKYDLILKEKIQEQEQSINNLLEAAKVARQEIDDETNQYKENLEWWRQHYEAVLEPIKQYEKEKQEKLFYTIQLPDEFKEDIEFLLTTVAAKVQHPDIISKLVWAEYVKPYLDDTFKRIEIKPESGIYKLTNINTGKAYIGKSTNVKTRIADHFKSSIGIKSIADQAVHHAILQEGFWNWMIEVITYGNKEDLSELEKYYIDFFKTQEFGYNRNAGG